MRTKRNVNDFIVISVMVITMAIADKSSKADANIPDINGLAHICIFTGDMSRSLAFYTDTLGFDVVHRTHLDSGYGFSIVRRGSCIIELLQPDDANQMKSRESRPIDHIALEVKDINTVVAKLRAKGINFFTPIIDDPNLMGGVRIAFFKGASGEVFELFEYLKSVPALHDTKAKKD
jgi:catechol 2,3-dioxygenase-like lactoylglutathione lyase family enzyme